jgi:hypothetical protein
MIEGEKMRTLWSRIISCTTSRSVVIALGFTVMRSIASVGSVVLFRLELDERKIWGSALNDTSEV